MVGGGSDQTPEPPQIHTTIGFPDSKAPPGRVLSWDRSHAHPATEVVMDIRPIPLEIARQLMDAYAVESAVRDEVERLLADRWRDANANGRRSLLAGRPVWWWRFRLIEWAWSKGAHDRCSFEALKALRRFLSDLTDEQLRAFVEPFLSNTDGMVDSA